MCPVPTGPVSTTRPANASRIGRARATDSGVAADHDVERSLPGVLRRAAQWCVDQRDPFRRELLRHAPRRGRLGGRAVDDEQGPADRSEPVLPLHDRLDLRRAGHAEHDDVALLGDLPRAGRLLRAASLEIVDRLALAMGEHGQRPAFLDDVLRHAVAHEPDADEADPLFHGTPPCASLVRLCDLRGKKDLPPRAASGTKAGAAAGRTAPTPD